MKNTFLSILTSFFALAMPSFGQTIPNGSFEDSTSWVLNNDAFIPFSSISHGDSWATPVEDRVQYTFLEDVSPIDGEHFAITYAGFDTLSQSIHILSDGTYHLSVYANAITGKSNTASSIASPKFALTMGDHSATFKEKTGDGWNIYTLSAYLTAGQYDIQIENLTRGVYSIAYDNVVVAPASIPEPSSSLLFGLSGALLFFHRRR